MNRRFTFLILLVPLLVVLSAAPAVAQYAQIEGTVKDQTGGVLPGATVTATNEETGIQRSATTGQDGFYRIPGLLPGVYTLRCEMPSFQSRSFTGIILTIQQTVIQHFAMEVAQIEETVTVTGESPIIDTKRSDVSTSVSENQIQDLPVASRRWVDLAMLTPGTSQDNIRGFYYRGNVNIGAGGREYSNAFIVDGVNNTWAEMGEARQNFPMDSIGEFKVSTSNFKAEYGLATGGLMTVVSKSGTNTPHGSGFLYFRNDSLNEKTYFEKEKPDYSRYQYGGSLGGPIVRDKAHFFFAYERTDETTFYTVNTNSVFPEYEGSFGRDEWRYMWLGKVSYEASPENSLWVRVAWEDEYRPNLQAGGIRAEGFDFAVPRNSEVFGWTWLASESAMNEFRFQRGFSKYEVSPAYSHGSFDAGDFSAERRALCNVEHIRPSLQLTSCNDQMGPETRWQFKDDLTYFKSGWGGDHQFKMGVDYNYVQFKADILNQSSGRFTWPTDRPYDPNDPSTFPVQYLQLEPRFADLPVHHFSVYFQDDWNPIPSLTLNLGLRYDLQKGVFNEDINDIDFGMEIPFNQGAENWGDTNNFGPRIGFAWDPSQNGRTVVKGGYGLFYDNIRTLLRMLNERVWHQAQQIVIANPSYPDPLQGRSRDEFVSTAPPNIEVQSPDFINPYAHQVNLGVSHMLTSEIAVSGDFTYVINYGDLDQGTDLNYPVNGVKPYPQFNRVAEDGSTLDHEYTGFYAKVEKRLSHGYQLLVSYTLSKLMDRQFRVDDVSTQGFALSDWYDATADRRHRLVASGILQLPYGVNLSTILDLRSSLPFNIHSGTDINRDTYVGEPGIGGGDLPPGVAPNSGSRSPNIEAINAYRSSLGLAPVSEGDIDSPGFANLDLRAQKSFDLGGPHQLQFIFQVLNVTNRANFDLPNGNLRSSGFGKVNQIPNYINAPARQIELAVRYLF